MKETATKLIYLYKKLFTILRMVRVPIFIYTDCKFHPSCSDYAVEAIDKYGVIKGSAKSVVRILRCSPFSEGGIDHP